MASRRPAKKEKKPTLPPGVRIDRRGRKIPINSVPGKPGQFGIAIFGLPQPGK